MLACAISRADAQQVLSLDSCRAMALRNNKQLAIAALKQDVARDARKAARTKYLPHVDVLGGYEFTSREVSILNDRQKGALGSLGTNAAGQLGSTMSDVISEMAGQGIITSQTAEALGNIAQGIMPGIEEAGNNMGKTIRDAFKTGHSSNACRSASRAVSSSSAATSREISTELVVMRWMGTRASAMTSITLEATPHRFGMSCPKRVSLVYPPLMSGAGPLLPAVTWGRVRITMDQLSYEVVKLMAATSPWGSPWQIMSILTPAAAKGERYPAGPPSLWRTAGKATTMMFCSLESWEMPYILLCLHFYRSRNWLSMLFRRTDSM